VIAYLDHSRLWYHRPVDNDCLLSYIDIADAGSISVRVSDEILFVFTLTVDNEKYKFKCLSKADMYSWVDCIRERNTLSAENAVILMADEYTSCAEYIYSALDTELLIDCASFEGTLKNK
jgi:hypothetical protein